MRFVYDLTGADPIVRDLPVYSATTAMIEGAAVMRGATPGTNQGFAIIAASACADILGVLAELDSNTSAGGDSKQDGTAYTRKKIIINPWAVFRAQYDTADDMDVASVATTTVTVTSLEDDIDGGWLLGDDAAGAYGTGTTASRLTWIAAAAAGSCTTKDDYSAVWTANTDLIKVLPLMHQLGKVNTAADKIGTDAAVGSALIVVLENYIEAAGVPLQPLDPTKHSGLSLFNPKVYSDIRFRDHAYVTLS
jgi:hypothetical protein